MQNVYEQKTIADLLTIKVVADEDPQSPREWDNAATLVCWSRRYTLGDEQPSVDPSEWLEGYKAANPEALIVPIYKYEHSGIALSTGAFSCPWDSGQCGYAVISADKIAKEWPLSDMHPTPEAQREAARKCIDAEVETYSAYCNGDVYGYIIEDEDGEQLDACFGFYGATEEALKAGEEAAAFYLPKAQSAKQEALRVERLEQAAPAMLAALERVAGVADTAASILAKIAPEEAARFREDAKTCRAAIEQATA